MNGPAAPNAVLFWNDIALDLNALDHTLPMGTMASAPGPTASAYMLGLVHLAMADACGSFPDANFSWFKLEARVREGDSKKAAIGGAAYGVLSHIYPRPPHSTIVAGARDRFLSQLRGNADGDVDAGWNAGTALGLALAQRYWDQNTINRAIGPDDYRPGRGEHNVDPDIPPLPGQRHYGVLWGQLIRALALSDDEKTRRVGAGGAVPSDPPGLQDPRYINDWNDVYREGERVGVTRDKEREEIALFWAYDGAREIGTPPRLYNQHVITIGRDDGLRACPREG